MSLELLVARAPLGVSSVRLSLNNFLLVNWAGIPLPAPTYLFGGCFEFVLFKIYIVKIHQEY